MDTVSMRFAEWLDRGLCVDAPPEMFDPEASSKMMRQARRICKCCPVQIECLEAAVENNAQGGVWGGVSGEVGHIAALRKAKDAEMATSDPEPTPIELLPQEATSEPEPAPIELMPENGTSRLRKVALAEAELMTEKFAAMQAAVDAGATWKQIGETLGLSKQGARSWFLRHQTTKDDIRESFEMRVQQERLLS